MLRTLRLLHLYLGVFISPALLFFSVTGALQTFSLHEVTRGSAYQPPRWAVMLGQIHKKQTAIVPVRRPPPPDRGSGHEDAPGSGPSIGDTHAPPRAQDGSPRPGSGMRASSAGPEMPASGAKRHSLPLKLFFLLVSIGLAISTLTGMYMAYAYRRGPVLVTVLLIAGVLIPLILIFV